MKWNKYIIWSIFLLLLTSCSEPTLEDDAKTAASLVNRSNKLAIDNDISGAGQTYAEAQNIIKKYRHTSEFNKFYELYSSFLEINSYNTIESSLKENDSTSNE